MLFIFQSLTTPWSYCSWSSQVKKKNPAQFTWFYISYWFIDNLQITANLWAAYTDQYQQQSRWNQYFGHLRNVNLCSQIIIIVLHAALQFLFKMRPFSKVSLQFPGFCLIQLMFDSLFSMMSVRYEWRNCILYTAEQIGPIWIFWIVQCKSHSIRNYFSLEKNKKKLKAVMLQLLLMVEKSCYPEWEDKLRGILIKAQSSSSLSQKSVSCYKLIIPCTPDILQATWVLSFIKNKVAYPRHLLNSTEQHICANQPAKWHCCSAPWDGCSTKPLQQQHSSWEWLKSGLPPAMPSSKNASSRLQNIRYTSSSCWPWDDLTLEVQIYRRKG